MPKNRCSKNKKNRVEISRNLFKFENKVDTGNITRILVLGAAKAWHVIWHPSILPGIFPLSGYGIVLQGT